MLKKSTFREIKGSIGRYIAILAIVALGVGFFSGLKVTREAMVSTANDYISEKSLFDYRMISTMGFEEQDISKFSELDGVKCAEGSISTDAMFDNDSVQNQVLMAHMLTKDVNNVQLSAGRLPEKAGEFVGDSRYFTKKDIGEKLKLSDDNLKDTKKMFRKKEFVLTGIIESPYYLNFERGSSSLGNGMVAGFIYISPESFDTEYYTEVFLKLKTDDEMYSDEYNDYIDNKKDYLESETEKIALGRYNRIVKEAQDELDDGKKEYRENYDKYLKEKKDAETELNNARAELKAADAELRFNREDIENNEAELNQGQNELNKAQADLDKKKAQFEASKDQMPPQMAAGMEAELNAGQAEINKKQQVINNGFSQLKEGKRKIAEGEKELEEGWADYNKGKAEADEKFADAEKELQKAKNDINDAQKEIDDIEKPETFVLDRNTNTGYVCFENDSNIVDGIAQVFPIFFFMVAALVCMTTMTRMVDEQRTQIGVLKALGYSNGSIMAKYLFYSGSAALIGCIVGFLAGCYIFPKVIWEAYQMMYDFSSDINYIINPVLAVASLLGALICSMGATMFSCHNEFKEVPAELIRPKAPKEGKRILLERIPFIWNRISFLYKVSFRNIFRYKKRFFMMVLGISGCTALLLTGFGLQDSIKNIVDYQYDEIQIYDYSVTFSDPLSVKNQEKFKAENKDHIKDTLFLHQSAADIILSSGEQSVNLVSTDGNQDVFKKFVDLHDKDGNKIQYPGKGNAVICQKIADIHNLNKGDKITIRNGDMKEMELTVSDICQNYVYNYIYITNETYKEGFNQSPEIKNAFVNTSENDKDFIYSSSGKILKRDDVVAVSVNEDFRNRVDNMMKSLDYIIILVILAAGALAFIVLYNLTNINITERIREIATIKVLGFYPNETSAYVFRENMFLTAISAVVGLFLGRLLHAFVMTRINIEMIYFDIVVLPQSYIYSVLLTFAFAIIVNVVMYFKLEKINMTESLKSIE